MIKVIEADPASPDAQPLLKALWAYHQERTPVEGQFWLGVGALSAPEVQFFLAYVSNVAVGCAAYSTHQSELKSMFVAPDARGTGVAVALIERIERAAKSTGFLRLETGPTHDAAIAFYKKSGFEPCEKFGDYAGSNYSLCMHKTLQTEC